MRTPLTPRWALLLAVALTMNVVGFRSAAAATPTQLTVVTSSTELPPPRHATKHPKLNTHLLAAVTAAEGAGGTAAGLAVAHARGVSVSGDKVRVIVTARGRSSARAAISKAYGRVEAEYAVQIQAYVPIGSVRALADDADVSYVDLPAVPVADAITDEGVLATNAGAWQTAGVSGAGVKVGIIDLGFIGYTNGQASGDLPPSVTTADFGCGGVATFTSHGTAVAEIVFKMAPGAQLYLICVSTNVNLGQAKDYAIAQGITVVNHSVGWFNMSRGDGTGAAGSPNAIAADARSHGILWVNSAGNEARSHWSGSFVTTDGDSYHDFAPGDELDTFVVGSGATICAWLKWDNWPVSAQDYDLYLFQTSPLSLVQFSEGAQTGTQAPIEQVCYLNSGATKTFGLAISRYSATTTPRFDLFISTSGVGPLTYQVAAGSLTEPADSASVMSVGAICFSTNALEPYSSQGPTIDARIKPDIAGQDATSSAVYGGGSCAGSGGIGSGGFTGTSASSPHVAGAAALVAQANPTFTPAQIQSFLEGRALDLGASGRDNQFGSGRLWLGAAPTATCATVGMTPSPAGPQPPGTSVTLTATSTGCSSAEYKFWVRPPGASSFTMLRDYGAAVVTWNTTGLASGTYTFGIWARAVGSSAVVDVGTEQDYLLQSSAPCTSVSMTPNPASPQSPGTGITLTASSAGCSSAEYKFWLRPPGASSFTVLRDYGAASFIWDTTGLASGTYTFSVWARVIGSSTIVDVGTEQAYLLQSSAPCTSVNMTPNPAGPQPPGTNVTLTAGSGGCSSAEYKFWVRAPNASSFTVLREYGAAAFIWDTSGLTTGTYTFGVWARSSGSSVIVDVGMEQAYLLQSSAPCTSVSMTPNPAGPQPPGTSVTLTASSSGCTSAEYKFWVRPPGAPEFTMLRDYGSSGFTWDTTGLASGTYTFGVWARATGSSTVVDVGMEQTYLLQSSPPCNSVSMTPNPASPQPPGTSVTLTASSTGCTSGEYRFWVRAPGASSFTMLRDYGAATFVWDTTGLAQGTYTFSVWARATGSSTVVDWGMEQDYVLGP